MFAIADVRSSRQMLALADISSSRQMSAIVDVSSSRQMSAIADVSSSWQMLAIAVHCNIYAEIPPLKRKVKMSSPDGGWKRHVPVPILGASLDKVT
jgi:hypothetical protein